MANIFPAVATVQPHYMIPENILYYNQASNYYDLLAGGDPMPRIGTGDLFVYAKALAIRTKSFANQAATNQLPSCTIDAKLINVPTYLIRNRAEYDHHDTAAGGHWAVSVPEAQRLGMRQGINQTLRNCGLYGFNAANGEGIINTAGATAVNLPADTFGNDTVLTYDNGQMAIYLLQQVLNLKTRMYQLGMPSRIEIVGPQRVLGQFEYPDIVQLVAFQRPGAGSDTTKGVLESVMEENGDALGWGFDDTLIGKGAGGNDAVVITCPEIRKPTTAHAVNTNEFALLDPGLDATVIQLCDMAAPREIPTPLAGGAIDVLSELRATPGWGLRAEAITIISMQYQ
jgi:hypothetical protein